jgi:hypothetical protein
MDFHDGERQIMTLKQLQSMLGAGKQDAGEPA